MHDNIAKCICLCSKLKKLRYGGGNVCQESLIKSFALLTNIDSLTVLQHFPNSVPRILLNNISSNLLKLKVLLIGRCEDASDTDLELICKLPNLEILHIFGFQNVIGSGFRHLSNLKELRCYECENIEDDSLISLLKCASNLELLHSYMCRKITNFTINFAIKVTKNRKNNTLLKIKISGSSVNTDKLEEISPLLLLDESAKLA